MANTIAQNPTIGTFTGGTTATADFAACTNPSLLIAMFTSEENVSITSVSDGTAYTQDALSAYYGDASVGRGKSAIYSRQNTGTSTLTVTVTLGAATYGILKIYEVTGAATSSAKDTSNTGGGYDTQPSVSITTGTANCTVVSIGAHYGGGAAGVDSGYTLSASEWYGSWSYHLGEHRADAGAAGAITLNWNGVSARNGWSRAVVAYKTAAGAATTRGMPFGDRSTAFNGGRTLTGIIR